VYTPVLFVITGFAFNVLMLYC